MTQTMKISAVRDQLNTLVNRVYRKETRVLVEQGGIPVAAIVSAEDLARLKRWEAERSADFTALDATQAACRDVPAGEVERELTRALAAVRAEAKADPTR